MKKIIINKHSNTNLNSFLIDLYTLSLLWLRYVGILKQSMHYLSYSYSCNFFFHQLYNQIASVIKYADQLTLQEFCPELDKAGPLFDVIPGYPPLCHIL